VLTDFFNKSELSCIFVLEVLISSRSTIFLLDFGTVPTLLNIRILTYCTMLCIDKMRKCRNNSKIKYQNRKKRKSYTPTHNYM